MISDEGYRQSHFDPIIPPKRRRNCYRIDDEQMNIEITRGRSDIYDILTHLTFLFIESHKIAHSVLDEESDKISRDWEKIELLAQKKKLSQTERELALIHIGKVLGRTFEEILPAYHQLSSEKNPERFIQVIYWLGKIALEEILTDNKRVITFSPILRERLGHHIYGEIWANTLKETLSQYNLLQRPLHIISANMHSVMNALFASKALNIKRKEDTPWDTYIALSEEKNHALREQVTQYALAHGMLFIKDKSGTNIDVQIVDTALIPENEFFQKIYHRRGSSTLGDWLCFRRAGLWNHRRASQALQTEEKSTFLNVVSVSIMGKAGILEGEKGDIMIPNAHIFEGTADNYPFENELSTSDFEGNGLRVFEGTMVTVLGTSLQNKDVLTYFHKSTWNVIGLEMEGAHYQKAIQSASKIRKSIRRDVKVRYAYYASDNPLETGSTLASGGLGLIGVKPTYLITHRILEQIGKEK